MAGEAELNNIKIALATMLNASAVKKVAGNNNGNPVTDLHLISAEDPKGATLYLDAYTPSVTSGYAYIFDQDGNVTQISAA